MIHLVCQTCGCESWSWSAAADNPIAADFTKSHEARGHTVVRRTTRRTS